MKQKYQQPELTFLILDEDVVTASVTGIVFDFDGWNDENANW